jgi:hypothetical protein
LCLFLIIIANNFLQTNYFCCQIMIAPYLEHKRKSYRKNKFIFGFYDQIYIRIVRLNYESNSNLYLNYLSISELKSLMSKNHESYRKNKFIFGFYYQIYIRIVYLNSNLYLNLLEDFWIKVSLEQKSWKL